MTFDEWQSEVPGSIRQDSLWRMKVYQIALFLGDLAWYDIGKLSKDRKLLSLSDQLYEATGSISANIAEGYSRASNKDQARFYEYSLGSARESRDWYFKGRHTLGAAVTHHRIDLLSHIIRQLLTIIPKRRGKYIKEEGLTYETTTSLEELLQDVPIPE